MPTTIPTAADDLRGRRQALGLTQTDVAIAASVSLAHVQNLERGLRPKRSAALARLLDALSCAEAGQSEAPGSTGAPRRVADGGDHDEQ